MKKIFTLLFIALGSQLFGQNCIPNASSVAVSTGNYLLVQNGTSMHLNYEITVEAWIYLNSFATQSWAGSIVNNDGWSAGESGFGLRCGSTGILSFNVATISPTGVQSSWKEAMSPANTLSLGTWTHVAGTYDGNTVKCFKNGVEVGSFSFTGSIDTLPLYDLCIGRIGDGAQGGLRYLDGFIDEVRIWNRALNATELATNMGNQIDPAAQNGLVSYWRFNDLTGTLASNEANSSFDADLIGAAYFDTIVPFNTYFKTTFIFGPATSIIGRNDSYGFNPNPGTTVSWSVTNGTITSGQGTPVINVNWTANGLNDIVVKETKGTCTDSSVYTVNVGGVGIEDVSNTNIMSLAPNPSSGVVQVKLSSFNNNSILLVKNALGQMVTSGKIVSINTSIDLGKMAKGLYFVQLQQDGAIRETKSLIIE